jgi:hypothetical protein
MAKPIAMVLEQTELLDDQAVAASLGRLMADPRGKDLQRLDGEARRRGYRKATGPQAQIGLRQRFKADKPVRPPKGVQAQPVQEVEFEISLSALDKSDSEDQAAIVTVRVNAGQNTEQYDMLLEANDGDFEDVREFKVENDQIVPAKSWWTATRNCITSRCGAICIGALVTCSGTWVAYLGCVAAACGGCWATCAACATCNCRWWCKWAAKCCRQ